MPATYYLNNVVLNWVRGVPTTPPAALFLAAATAVANAKTPTFTEVANSNGYSRAAVSLGAPSNGVSQNSSVVVFPPAAGSWGTISHVVIVTAGTYGDGDALITIALDTPIAIAAGQQFSFDLTTYRLSVTAD